MKHHLLSVSFKLRIVLVTIYVVKTYLLRAYLMYLIDFIQLNKIMWHIVLF